MNGSPRLLGCDGWFLWNPFHLAAEEGIARPGNNRALTNLLRRCLNDDNLQFSPHCLQIFTEEDGEAERCSTSTTTS